MKLQKAVTKHDPALPRYSRLFRRGAIYYFRVVVPRELQTVIGKTEIIKSLRTPDFSEAKRLVPFESAKADSLLQAARSKLQRTKPPPRQLSKLSDAEIQGLVLEWFSNLEKESEEWYQKEGRNLNADARREVLEDLGIEETALTAAEGDGGAYQPVNADFYLDRFLSEKGILCGKDSPEYQTLSEVFHRGRLTNIRNDVARIEGRRMPEDGPLFRNVSAYSVLPAAKPSITLGELLNRFLDYIKQNRSETTFSTYQTPARVIREVLGENTPVRAITRESIDGFFNLLKRSPRNLVQRYPGLTTEQAIAAAEKCGDVSKLSPKSLENYYTNVLAVFNFAVEEKELDYNPANFRSLRDQYRRKERKKKPLFTAEQLSEIFHSPLYERSWKRMGADPQPFPYGRFFVPLLALFQGFRMNEACQLYTEDIKESSGIPFIAVRTEREDGVRYDKRLKNVPSIREVPIHDMILRCGFMDFVEERRLDSTSPRLFPELPAGKTRRYSNPFSKWFSRFLRSIFDEKPRATFHSFRHHFADALRAKRVPDEISDRLGGWSSPASQRRHYGHGIPLKLLSEELNKIEYPDLDLSHLYVR